MRLRQTAVGVNFHAIYVRSGLYNTLPLPGIPGLEGVGVVEAVGPSVEHVKLGDRVGCLTIRYGSYAEERLADDLHPAPAPERVYACGVVCSAATVSAPPYCDAWRWA